MDSAVTDSAGTPPEPDPRAEDEPASEPTGETSEDLAGSVPEAEAVAGPGGPVDPLSLIHI